MAHAAVIIPCYDEAARLDASRFLRFVGEPFASALEGPHLLFVDDGSRDQTHVVLEGLHRASPTRVRVLRLGENRGKGEAVRLGMLDALANGASIVGYADADLSTPPEEIRRLFAEMETPERRISVVVGSRVLLVGRNIVRKRTRHMLGRVFANLAAAILDTPFYDTQCGAKLFRDTPALRAALATPFLSRWAFDVELLGRLLLGAPGTDPVPRQEFLEVPLQEWVDTAESKLKLGGMAKSLVDMGRIDLELRRLRRARGGGK